MKNFDSQEAETLKKLILDKKLFLSTLNNKYAFQRTQKEILFLEKEILPIIINNTSILNYETSNYVAKMLDIALQFHCNGLIIYFPLDEKYDEKPILGVANPFYFAANGTPNALNIEVSIQNRDGYDAPVQPINLPIHQLI